MSPRSLKLTAKRSRLGVVAGRIAVERTRDVRRMLGRRDGPMGATHRRFDLEGSVSYIDEVFGDYLTYGGLETADLADARVLELGPGDNLGVALRFAAAGASVVAADRFVPFRDPAQERRIYEAMLERLPEDQRRRVAPMAAEPPDPAASGVELLELTPIERAPERLAAAGFDLIVSRAVLEHVYDLDGAFAAMDKLLRPGATMVHKVDLRDHGMFSEGGQNALTFLTIGDRSYAWMGEESAGLPNRRLIGWYRAKLAQLGYEARFWVTHVAGIEAELVPHQPLEQWVSERVPVAAVSQVRPRLQARYRSLDDSELAIAGFMVAAQKPADG
jgi:SAM-dependent methyltransferase